MEQLGDCFVRCVVGFVRIIIAIVIAIIPVNVAGSSYKFTQPTVSGSVHGINRDAEADNRIYLTLATGSRDF